MKVIFLDFDGVITTLKSNYNLDLEKMKMVKRICDETGAKIVVSSSWRYHTLEKTIEYITTIGCFRPIPFLMPELVVGVTPRFYFEDYNNKSIRIPRGLEIDHYLRLHEEIENYVILDDDSDMLLSQKDNFIKTDTYEGISEADVEKSIRILNA